ncbi:GGDEF domain-containing protein, partial [Wenyingzhuangia sp. 1_MG-2023]|nr:GGDEF domain-containing protein [Wenyingzhuangia sp. 1_MG-2023]
HLLGDEVLKRMARLLEDNTRTSDQIGRWGGEEFMIILPDTSAALAYRLAEKIRTAIAAEQFEDADHVTTSIGLVESLQPGQSARQLLLKADKALYQAKSRGRNCVVVAVIAGDDETCYASEATD